MAERTRRWSLEPVRQVRLLFRLPRLSSHEAFDYVSFAQALRVQIGSRVLRIGHEGKLIPDGFSAIRAVLLCKVMASQAYRVLAAVEADG